MICLTLDLSRVLLLQAATCFNQIMLPPYDSVETMRGKLELAINEVGSHALQRHLH